MDDDDRELAEKQAMREIAFAFNMISIAITNLLDGKTMQGQYDYINDAAEALKKAAWRLEA